MAELRVAVAHYHLHPGGVTRVIENAARALKGQGIRLAVLSGEPYEGKVLDNVRVVDGLGYLEGPTPGQPADLAARLLTAATSALGDRPDVLHFHNHSLGKNALIPGAVSRLTEDGVPLLLQMHDFAEDGRPSNYRALRASPGPDPKHQPRALLYPIASQVHYVVLNGRDYSLLSAAGLPPDRLHPLPNPVVAPVATDTKESPLAGASRIFFYPTRGIRRKNMGEFVLWAALAGKDDLFASSLPPANPFWKPVYDRWVEFAAELNLPVRFGVVEQGEFRFDDWTAAAFAMVTTSIAEGFGLAFLEPWLMRKPLAGRNLPEITGDFGAEGVELGGLYERLQVPLDLVGRGSLRRKIAAALQVAYERYGRRMPGDAVDQACAAVFDNDGVDFAGLDEELQEQVIRSVAGSAERRTDISPSELSPPVDPELIEVNRNMILRFYGLEIYGRKLAGLYRTVAGESIETPDFLAPDRVLDVFMDPARFRLLRS